MHSLTRLIVARLRKQINTCRYMYVTPHLQIKVRGGGADWSWVGRGWVAGLAGARTRRRRKQTPQNNSGRHHSPSHHAPREFHDAVRGPPPHSDVTPVSADTSFGNILSVGKRVVVRPVF